MNFTDAASHPGSQRRDRAECRACMDDALAGWWLNYTMRDDGPDEAELIAVDADGEILRLRLVDFGTMPTSDHTSWADRWEPGHAVQISIEPLAYGWKRSTDLYSAVSAMIDNPHRCFLVMDAPLFARRTRLGARLWTAWTRLGGAKKIWMAAPPGAYLDGRPFVVFDTGQIETLRHAWGTPGFASLLGKTLYAAEMQGHYSALRTSPAMARTPRA